MLTQYFSKLQKKTDDKNRQIILSLVPKCKDIYILDLGCGDGSLTAALGDAAKSKNLFGVEVADKYIQYAESRCITVRKGDLNQGIPFEDESFDLVCANQVIEHLHQTDKLLSEIKRVLKPGGLTIISTPNLACSYHIISLVFGWQPTTAFVSDDYHVGNPTNPMSGKRRANLHPGHLRIFTMRSLKELLEVHGYKSVSVRGIGYYPFDLSRIDPKHSVYLTATAIR